MSKGTLIDSADDFVSHHGAKSYLEGLIIAIKQIEALQSLTEEAVAETEDRRFFSFQYCFYDHRRLMVRHGGWNYESPDGFPNSTDILIEIETYLLGKGVHVEKKSVCLTGWQEFRNEEDYRNFTR